MNYTGDVLNFGVAVEKTMARNPDIDVEVSIVRDDVDVPRSRAGKVGRRVIAGTVLVHKNTGALAEIGCSLQDVAKVGRLASRNIVSIGVSLDRVHVPGRMIEDPGDVSSKFETGEVKLGKGTHNEAGSERKREKEAELPELLTEMLRQLLSQEDEERSFFHVASSKVVLLLNNLGSLGVLELAAVATEIVGQLRSHYEIEPIRTYVGTFMTSLNGSGFSISIQPRGHAFEH